LTISPGNGFVSLLRVAWFGNRVQRAGLSTFGKHRESQQFSNRPERSDLLKMCAAYLHRLGGANDGGIRNDRFAAACVRVNRAARINEE
jgi:hypothetical protein